MRYLVPAVAMLAVTAAVPPAGAVSPFGLELEFERLNTVYENLEADVEPIRSGPLTIWLSSPEHQLELLSHQIQFLPAADGRQTLKASARFSGSGKLIAEFDFGGLPATLEDHVEFPEQQAELEAEVVIEVVEGGYQLTTKELPPYVDIEIKSRLGSELVTWCERLALFLAGDAGCDELDEQLSSPRLPLPSPGGSYLVRSEDLTAEERARIDLYLADF